MTKLIYRNASEGDFEAILIMAPLRSSVRQLRVRFWRVDPTFSRRQCRDNQMTAGFVRVSPQTSYSHSKATSRPVLCLRHKRQRAH